MVRVKNNKIKPEKLVEQEVRFWAFQMGFSLDVYDSKMIVFGGQKRRNPGLQVSTSDLVGNDSNGLALYIELKAPGECDVCRIGQHQFLTRKILSNAFGAVVSSSKDLEQLYKTWLSLRKNSFKEANDYLLDKLPKKVLIEGKVHHLHNK